jgi:transposase
MCKTCLTIWNRDINACRNIITVAKNILETGSKPNIFSNCIKRIVMTRPEINL